jgi:hypothetical protein
VRTMTARPGRSPHPVGIASRAAVGPVAGVPRRLDPLPEPGWRQWSDVLVNSTEGTPVPVAVVVLGPSGVYVVTRQESSTRASFALRTREAELAAAAVRAALPGRYRSVVSALLMVEAVDSETEAGPETGPVGGATGGPGGNLIGVLVGDLGGSGVLVGEVIVATAPVLVEVMRFRPRVLSRSEAGVVASVLAGALVPRVAERAHPGLWGRFRAWLDPRGVALPERTPVANGSAGCH